MLNESIEKAFYDELIKLSSLTSNFKSWRKTKKAIEDLNQMGRTFHAEKIKAGLSSKPIDEFLNDVHSTIATGGRSADPQVNEFLENLSKKHEMEHSWIYQHRKGLGATAGIGAVGYAVTKASSTNTINPEIQTIA